MNVRYLAIAAALLGSAPALATVPDNYAFGYSSYDGLETLTVNNAVINTNGVQGWVSPNSIGNEAGPDGNSNYIAGTADGGSVFADFFVFSLAGLTDNVTSAALSISPFSITQPFTYVLHDATPFAAMLPDANSPNPALYSDLGTGTILGSFAVTPSESYGAPLVFNLNSTGLSLLNADISAGATQFAISGTVLGQAGATGTVPEISTWLMMILGFGAIGGMMRRAYRKSEENFTRKVRSLATA